MHRLIVKKSAAISGLLALAAGGLMMAGCASARPEQATLLAQAKIGRAEATLAALAQVPGGRIKGAELDDDDGKLTWWFDIMAPGAKTPTEVSVDAVTGGVICVATEVPER
jgi:uncharacterized membrane protein YkoI